MQTGSSGIKTRMIQHARNFEVRKYTATAGGLEPVTSLPKNKNELDHLAKRCDAAQSWIAAVHACLGGPFFVKDTFKRDGGDWCLFVGQTKMPLLEKQPPKIV